MIAYNRQQLDHLAIQDAAEEALQQHCISQEECQHIRVAYPVTLYTPNIFIRFGLFILTVVIALFSLALILLMSEPDNPFFVGVLCMLCGLGAYVLLEAVIISHKQHFRSGVDDALIWVSSSFIVGSICLFMRLEFSERTFCLVVFLVSLFFTLRFADRIMGLVAFLSFFAMIFYTCIYLGSTGRAIAPFLLMAASFIVYFLLQQISIPYYQQTVILMTIATLITGYIAGNYFIVRETSNTMFNLQPGATDGIPAGWLFWIFTVSIPLLYLYLGLRRKDRILICTGLLLIAAIVFTIRYYHAVVPLDIAMILGGLTMIGIAYAVTRYLQPSRHGFTSEAVISDKSIEMAQLESLIIAQTMSKTPGADDTFQFGEGSGGGAGASGDY